MVTFIKYTAIFIVGYLISRINLESFIKSTENSDQFTITKLSYKEDGESYFEQVAVSTQNIKSLGKYSDQIKVQDLYFRNSLAADAYDFHTAPQKQYIIYLSGSAEIETSEGDKKLFKAGDILLAADTFGKGHKSTITKNGKALVITLD